MSDCPAAVSDYKILDLCADIDGLASALGHETYVLGIHDWGAIVGWNVAQLYPQRVRAVIGMSVPYTRGFDPAWCTQAFWGDTFLGDTFSGDTFFGDTFLGDTFLGDTFLEDTFLEDTFLGDIDAFNLSI